MTTPTPPPRSNSMGLIVIAVTIAFVVTVSAATAIAIAVTDGARASSLIGLVVGPFASLIGVLVLLAKVGGIDNKVDEVHQNTHALTNGLMDAKIRDGVRSEVAALIKPELLNSPAAEAAARLLEPHAAEENGDPA